MSVSWVLVRGFGRLRLADKNFVCGRVVSVWVGHIVNGVPTGKSSVVRIGPGCPSLLCLLNIMGGFMNVLGYFWMLCRRSAGGVPTGTPPLQWVVKRYHRQPSPRKAKCLLDHNSCSPMLNSISPSSSLPKRICGLPPDLHALKSSRSSVIFP